MALPVVVTLNTDVMAIMLMQIWPSDDVVDLSFSAQKSHDYNRLTSEHFVLDEFDEFPGGAFCPTCFNTSFDYAFEKPGSCLTASHRKVAAKGLQSGHDYTCMIRQSVLDGADEFSYDFSSSRTALSRTTRGCATLMVDTPALVCDSLTKIDFEATTRIQPAAIYHACAEVDIGESSAKLPSGDTYCSGVHSAPWTFNTPIESLPYALHSAHACIPLPYALHSAHTLPLHPHTHGNWLGAWLRARNTANRGSITVLIFLTLPIFLTRSCSYALLLLLCLACVTTTLQVAAKALAYLKLSERQS